MATFEVTYKGQTFEVTAPDGASDEDVQRFVASRLASFSPGASAPQPSNTATQPEATLGEIATDAGTQFVRGINRGVDNLISLPGDIVGGVADLAGFPETAEKLRWRNNNPVSRFMQATHDQPETTAGRYANSMGQAMGGAAPIAGALTRAAPALAAIRPTTGASAVAQDIGQAYASRPALMSGLDVAAAGSGAAAMQGAADSGWNTAGQLAAGFAGSMVPGIGLAYMRPGTGRVGTETGETLARRRANEMSEDMDAFERLGVRSFGPSHHNGPMASVAKQLSETPVIGSPLRQGLEETINDAAEASRRLSSSIAPNATHATAGANLQAGVERFAQSRLADLDPGTVRGLGIDPNNPIQARDIMSSGQEGRLNQATALRNQLAVDGPAPTRNAYLTRRTTADDLSDAELNRLIAAPAAQTSFAAKSEALYERARRMVPTLMRSNGSRDPMRLPAVNTRIAMEMIERSINSSFQGQRTINRGLADRILSNRSHFSLDDLFAIRTQVGRDLGATSPLQTGLDRQQLSQLYAGLSQDIENGLVDIANRALLATQQSGPRALSMREADRAQGALRAFRTASRHHRAGMQRVESAFNLMRANDGETVVRKLLSDSREGIRGSAVRFRRAMQMLRPSERNEFAALVVREMGDPTDGAGGVIAEAGWSPQRFVTSYNRMSPESRNLIFEGEHRQALDDLFRVARRLQNVEDQANKSRTATNAINFSGAVGAIGSVAAGDLVTPMIIGGSGFAASVLMSRPQYARWLARYIQLRAAIRDGTDRTVAPLIKHVAGLEREAPANPALWPVLQSVYQDINERREQ